MTLRNQTNDKYLLACKNLQELYPGVISNNTLYKKCSVTKLADRVSEYHWRMLRYILRSDENTVAQLVLTFPFDADKRLIRCIRRSRSDLFTLIKNDLSKRNLRINSITKLNDVRDIARSREHSKNLF